MTLSTSSKIVTGIILLAQTIGLYLIALPMGQKSPTPTIEDPIRLFLFMASIGSFATMAIAYMVFDLFVCKRIKSLSDETWMQGGHGVPWINEKNELATMATAYKLLYSRNNESAERENLIADHALDLICSLNTLRIIVAINPASLMQIGYAPVSIMGRPMDRILPEEEIARLDQALKRARSESTAVTLDLVIKTMSGVLKDFRWTCEWSESAGLFYCVARDVSSEKQLERVKQEFFSMVSHDLRTPITSVRAFMTHLEEGGPYGTLSEKGKRHLHGVEENLDRMIRLTTDLLDLDKLEGGQMQLEQDAIKMQDLVRSSVDSVRQLAEQKRINLVAPDTDLEAYGDLHRLAQVLVNLLSNAIKFSPEDSSVEINVINLRHQIEVQVVDHGRGIPQAMQDIIFERYKQVEVADHKVKKGSGLGLAIAKAFIDAHNGQIGVSSEEGKGTKFWFRINRPKSGRSIPALKS